MNILAFVLPGIGFAKSAFFAGVAFGTSDALALSAKIGILAGSVASAALEIAFLAVVAAGKKEPFQHEEQAI